LTHPLLLRYDAVQLTPIREIKIVNVNGRFM